MGNTTNAHQRAMVENINWNIAHLKELYPDYSLGEISDTFHTFDELYDHRAKLFATICNMHKKSAWKSKLHEDNTMFPGMFVVGIDTGSGMVTYHYDTDPYWDMFDVKVLPHAPHWDGHTPEEAIERILSMGKPGGYPNGAATISIVNEFTEACDKHLLDEWIDPENGFKTYMLAEWGSGTGSPNVDCPIRFPGATRGHVTINIPSNKIVDIKFYPDVAYEDRGHVLLQAVRC